MTYVPKYGSRPVMPAGQAMSRFACEKSDKSRDGATKGGK